jgi:hypothetical protein
MSGYARMSEPNGAQASGVMGMGWIAVGSAVAVSVADPARAVGAEAEAEAALETEAETEGRMLAMVSERV